MSDPQFFLGIMACGDTSAMREFGDSAVFGLPPCSAAWGLATDGAWAVSAGFSFAGASAVGAGVSFAGASAVGAGFMGARAFGAGDFGGTLLGCWSILPPGAFGSCVAAPGASPPVPCAEANPAPAMSAVAATVTSKVFLMVFFIETSNKSDCSSVITRQIVFAFQVIGKICTV
jgi:hypothetical protein